MLDKQIDVDVKYKLVGNNITDLNVFDKEYKQWVPATVWKNSYIIWSDAPNGGHSWTVNTSYGYIFYIQGFQQRSLD